MIFGLFNNSRTSSKLICNSKDEVVLRYYHEHSDLGEDDYHEWILLGKVIKCDTNGKPHPNMNTAEWVAVACNNWSCRAQATIHPARFASALLEATGNRIFDLL